MNNNWKYYIGIVFVALLFVLANSVYIVNQAEQAIVLQFGEPVRLVKEPGLKFKIPFIQNVTLYDTAGTGSGSERQKTSGRRQFYPLQNR